MKEAKGPSEVMLNALWYETFGHTYQACKILADVPGEVGEPHRGHMRVVMGKAADQYKAQGKPSEPPAE